MSFLYYSLLLLFLVLSLFLVLLVLVQKGRGGGLSAAFGGVGGNTAFGAKTGDVLTWATSIIFGVFLLLAISLNLIANRVHATMTNPEAPAAVMASPTTVPTAAAAETVKDTREVLTPAGAGQSPVNPTPQPPPTPTTNPSTNPVRAERDAAAAIAPAATQPVR